MSGSSMIPTLSEPMILETSRVEHYIQGDVVVFTDKNSNNIVHRIVRLTKSGFITRGDNNLTDDEPIVLQDILGKVVAAYRGDKCYRVSEGKNGYRVHLYLQIRKNILRYPLRLLSLGYHLLSRTDFFAKLLPLKYKPKIIQYQNSQAQMYFGKILAGRYDLHRQHWIISRPWRIFIDEKTLPKPNDVITNPMKVILQNISQILDCENTLIPALNQQNWNELFEFAEKQDVACYIYYALKQKKSENFIPEEWKHKIRLQLMNFSANNLKHFNELEEIALAFENAGKPFIFLKGSHLAFHVYPAPSLRPMGDIDIVVREDNISKVMDVLNAKGYSSEYFTIESAKKCHWHFPPYYKNGKKRIELHWTLIKPEVHDAKTGKIMNWLFNETEEKKFGKGTALVFKPDALLFQLMLHFGLNDNLRLSLKKLLDISVLIQKYQQELNWEAISAKILETNFVRRFALIAWLAKNTVGAKIPDHFFQTLNAEPSEEIKEIALNRIIHFSEVDITNYQLAMLHANLVQKLFIMLKTVIISPERMRYQYDLKTNFEAILYYPKRIFDVTRNHLSDVLTILNPEKESMVKTKEELNLRAWLENGDSSRL